MRRNRIIAVETVELEAPCDLRDELRWFYGELVGLEEIIDDSDSGIKTLCFRSASLEIRIHERPAPRIESIRRCATLLVLQLGLVAQELDEHGVAYQPISGLNRCDRRLGTNDPAGNRVELKQEWPPILL